MGTGADEVLPDAGRVGRVSWSRPDDSRGRRIGEHGLRAAASVTALLAALALAASSHATPIGLGLREYRFSLYRPSVHAGRVVFNMTNFGEDKHNLRLTGPHGYRSSVSPEVEPFGGRVRFTVNLRRAGTYRLVCLQAGHLAKGMKATLKVTRRHAS